jgi:hypothetical protein
VDNSSRSDPDLSSGKSKRIPVGVDFSLKRNGPVAGRAVVGHHKAGPSVIHADHSWSVRGRAFPAAVSAEVAVNDAGRERRPSLDSSTHSPADWSSAGRPQPQNRTAGRPQAGVEFKPRIQTGKDAAQRPPGCWFIMLVLLIESSNWCTFYLVRGGGRNCIAKQDGVVRTQL